MQKVQYYYQLLLWNGALNCFHNVMRTQEGVSHWRDCCQVIMNRLSTPGTGLALTILAGWGRKFQALLCSQPLGAAAAAGAAPDATRTLDFLLSFMYCLL